MSYFRADRCRIIAEVAQLHDGSLGAAHALVDAAARAGADAVKFQTHIAEAESTPGEPWRVKFSPQDASRYDYWRRTAFTEEQWIGLRERADARGIEFLSSPFSPEAVDLLSRVGVPAWKIPSGELTNPLLLDAAIGTGLPIILSTGMGTMDEIDRAVSRIRKAGNEVAVLQCSSVYPTPPEQVGLEMLPVFRKRYGCAVGLSDHSGTIFPGLAAATLGAEVLEVHFTPSRELFGPDVTSSVTTEELRTLVQGVRFLERARAAPADKDRAAAALAETRRTFTKALVASADLPQGTVLRADDLVARKPCAGIPVDRLSEVLGRRTSRSVRRGEFLQEDDVEPQA